MKPGRMGRGPNKHAKWMGACHQTSVFFIEPLGDKCDARVEPTIVVIGFSSCPRLARKAVRIRACAPDLRPGALPDPGRRGHHRAYRCARVGKCGLPPPQCSWHPARRCADAHRACKCLSARITRDARRCRPAHDSFRYSQKPCVLWQADSVRLLDRSGRPRGLGGVLDG